MPARKHREGEELDDWLARKERFKHQALAAREHVKVLSGHTLLRLEEAAAMIGVTKKTLRDLEAQNLPNWPMRVTLSPKITGYRLKDLEALIDGGMVEAVEAEAAE